MEAELNGIQKFASVADDIPAIRRAAHKWFVPAGGVYIGGKYIGRRKNNKYVPPQDDEDDSYFKMSIVKRGNIMETNRLVSELMAGNLSDATRSRIYNAAKAENAAAGPSLNIGGKRYGGRKMLRSPEQMNAGMERGNQALIKKHNIADINLDKYKSLKPLRKRYAAFMASKEMGDRLKHARDTAIPGSPARKEGDAVLKHFDPTKAGYLMHSPSDIAKMGGSKSLMSPVVRRHEIHEFEAMKKHGNKDTHWRTSGYDVASNHAHPEVLAKEMNDVRRLKVHGVNLGKLRAVRKQSGEVRALKSITGKTYGAQDLSKPELRKVASMKPEDNPKYNKHSSFYQPKKIYNLTGRADKERNLQAAIAKQQPEFKKGEADLQDFSNKMHIQHGSMQDLRNMNQQYAPRNNKNLRWYASKRLAGGGRYFPRESCVSRVGRTELMESRRVV